MYDKCWQHAENIIKRHKGSGFQGSGLAKDYLALFCANNDKFAPGGSLQDQNEILWTIPYEYPYTESYGGTMFFINMTALSMHEPQARTGPRGALSAHLL